MKNYINNLIELTENKKDELLIVVIGNVKGFTKIDDDYTDTSIISEYYSQQQFDDIVIALRSNKFIVKCYFDELDFIHDYSLKCLSNLYPLKPLVINFAQKGTSIGRKSLIPSFCDLNHIIHTNCNAFVASLCREKYICSRILKGLYHTVESWLYSYKYGWISEKPLCGEKVIVKLINESSSIGLTYDNVFVYNEKSDKKVRQIANKYKTDVVVQKFISGFEVEVPFILTNECHVFDPIGISLEGQANLNDGILDYEIRGNHKFGFYDFNKQFPDLSKKIMLEVKNVAKFLNIEGLGRIDFRIDNQQNYYITDINANPHITKSMTVYYAMQKLGFEDYADTLKMFIGTAISRHPN